MTALQTALELALTAHAGQIEQPGNTPYIQHPLRVMHAVDGLETKIVGVLHDALEDSDLTAEDLRAAGFSETVIAGVQAVTRGEGEPYADFILRCKANPLARLVKLADLQDNFNLPRTLFRRDRWVHDLSRLAKYVLAYQFLTDRIDEAAYLESMADTERKLTADAP